jgi:hypothetical protein
LCFVCYTYRPDSVGSDEQVDLVDKAILERYLDLFGLQLPDTYQLLPDPDAILVYLFQEGLLKLCSVDSARFLVGRCCWVW